MAKIVWIASYPKSGNTWIRTLVCNLVFGPQPSTADIRTRIPDIHEGFTTAGLNPEDGRLVKTHFKYSPTHPHLDETAGAICLVRNPLQVLASRLNFMRLSQTEDYYARPEEDRAAFDRQYVADYIAAAGAPSSIKLGMGSWNENVDSWLHAEKPFPVFAARYEDLARKPERIATKLCKFLSLDRSAVQIAAAVEAASFGKLKSMEEAEISKDEKGFFAGGRFVEGHKHGKRFMNEGATDSYKAILTADEIAKATDVFRPLMETLKYL